MNTAGHPTIRAAALQTRKKRFLHFFGKWFWARIAGALLASQARYYPRFLCPSVKFMKQMYSGINGLPAGISGISAYSVRFPVIPGGFRKLL